MFHVSLPQKAFGREIASSTSDRPITVKFVMRRPRYYPPEIWLRQFPGQLPVWGQCRFVFDSDARRYDWLVAYDDLPPERDDGSSQGCEDLACPQKHTILVTTEPSSIKRYSRHFVAQFGCVLTSQSAEYLVHTSAIRAQPALRWLYGVGRHHQISFDDMVQHPPLAKSRMLSMVVSSKRMRHTVHHRRYRFTKQLKSLLPDLEIYGHGLREMDDKAEALDPYKYTIVVENFVGPHHWTEKLADAFLGCCLPIYYGCPNVADYFPDNSFISIDISDPERAARTISAAVESGEYENRLSVIMEARRRVLYEYNLFAVLSRLIAERNAPAAVAPGTKLLSRHAVRHASPATMVTDTFHSAWRLLFAYIVGG